MQVNINQITIDEAIYPRSAVDLETVERYREALESGAKLPPLVLMPNNKLIDGRHRLEAYRLLGAEAVEAEIEEPADPDARAVELNLRHGRPLTRQELREAARRWYGKKPVTEIAGLLGVTRQTVQNWVSDLVAEREEARADLREQAMRMRAEGLTQEEVAERLGIARRTVSYWENQEWQSVKNLTLCHTENSSQAIEQSVVLQVEADLAAEREETRMEVREQALRMRAEGLTQEEVAEKLGVPQQTISYWEKQEYQSVKNLTLWYTENSSRVIEKPAVLQVDADLAAEREETRAEGNLQEDVTVTEERKKQEYQSEKNFSPCYTENSSIAMEREDADNSSYGDGGKEQKNEVDNNEAEGNKDEKFLERVVPPQEILEEIPENSVAEQEYMGDDDTGVFNYEPVESVLTEESKPFTGSLLPRVTHVDSVKISPVSPAPVQTGETNKVFQAQTSQPRQSIKDNSEFRSSLEKVTSLCRELGGAIDRVLKNHSGSLSELAQENDIVDGESLHEIASKTADAMAYMMFRLSLEFLSDRLSGLFDLLEKKPPKFTVLKGGKSSGEKN